MPNDVAHPQLGSRPDSALPVVLRTRYSNASRRPSTGYGSSFQIIDVKFRHPIINDAWGGFASMMVALPSAIAYGVAVYGVLGPEFVPQGVRAGLIGAVVIGLIAAMIGGAPRLISAPSAPAAAVLASVAGALLADSHFNSPDRVVVMLAGVGVLAGALQTLYGALGGGRLIKFIPYPVVAGYLSAVAVLIALSQVPRLLGLAAKDPLGTALLSPELWRMPAVVVGAVTVIGMLLAPRITRRIPASILGLSAGTAAYFILSIFEPGLRHIEGNSLLLGHLTGNTHGSGWWHTPGVFDVRWADIKAIAIPALTLSVLLSVDSLKTCVIVDALTFTRHDANRTLLGQGLGNVAAAALGGMPGSGTIGATLVNVESGGTSRVSGAAEALFVLVAVVVFGRWISWVPVAGLAGVLLVVAARMFDWTGLQLVRQRSTMLDFIVIGTVVMVAVTTNLIAAAGAGVALAMVLFIRDQIRGSILRRKTRGNRVSSKQHRLPGEQAVLERFGSETVVCELQGSLFFGTTDQLFRELEAELKTCRFLVIDLRRVQSIDYTATHLFEQFEAMLRPRDGWLLFSRVPQRRELRDYLAALETPDHKRHVRTFETLDDALQWTEDQLIAQYMPASDDPTVPLDLAAFELTRELQNEPGLAALAACAVERSFRAGEAVFHADAAADDLFLVRRGVVRVTLPLNGNGYHTLATFGRGHFFGEMAFLVRGPRSANATATTATDVFVISRAKFDAVSRAHPIIGVKIFARLAQTLAVRLRRADAELRASYDA